MIDAAGFRTPLPILAIALVLAACGDGGAGSSTRFELLAPERTGVRFENTITPTEEHDFRNHAFIYNGAGVALGDVDGDGLTDIYLTGNMVSSRLFLNRGEMRFTDVTEEAGVATDRWATGASMVDIDADGDLDIYVSVSGPDRGDPARRANLLFVNRGDGTFVEEAARWGIADTGFTTHSAFLDHDRDGDLDLYLLGNSPGEFARGDTGQPQLEQGTGNPAGFDRLYRNDGNGSFSDVSAQAGILARLGYGLGVVVADLNRDGWPDIYVSNDIAPNDVLYVNNGDGTFTDRLAEWLDHTSYAGMGVDIADFSNDGWPDILQADMTPAPLAERKRVSGTSTFAALEALRSRGFSPQHNLNTLQLSRGPTPAGGMTFSQVSRMAGVAYTDWSWTTLFADWDNDGLKDILITNGYPKAVTDLDYQANSRTVMRLNDRRMGERLAKEMLDSLPGFEVANHVFRNEGDLTFSDRSHDWGLREVAYSYGAAAGDLDNDGRLDLVVNNIDAPAYVYRNVPGGGPPAHFLRVVLAGEGANRRGLGAKVTVVTGERRQYVDHTPYRGFMSTMDDRVHFGLGGAERVDSLEVVWPDGRVQRLAGLPVDTTVTLRQRDAVRLREAGRGAGAVRPLLQALGAGVLPYEHRHASYRNDFELQPLLPYQLSSEGPPLAVADVDGDGREDVFVGGGPGGAGVLFLQRGGGFVEAPHPQPWAADSAHDDWGATFVDADGDGRPDLYVASGGYHLAPRSRLLQDRLYLNRGDGRFEAAPGALPEMRTSTAAVAAADYDGDGRTDLFVAGRLAPGDYPSPVRSHLLHNEGGRFSDVTAAMVPELADSAGMVTAAAWVDFDGDGALDLVTAGIWMPIRFFRNEGARLREVTGSTGLSNLRGWWYSLAVGDLDADGDADLVAGNLGLNHTYTTAREGPFGVYAADFSGDRVTDIVFTQEVDGREYPFYGLALLGRDFDALTAAYPTVAAFSDQTVADIFGAARLGDALHYQADTFASVWLRNDGGGRFSRIALPPIAQISPVRAILVEDLDRDGHADLLLAGNTLRMEPNSAPADAGKGLWLKGDGQGRFRPFSPAASGFLAPGDVRALATVATPGGRLLLVSNHAGPLQAFTVTPPHAN